MMFVPGNNPGMMQDAHIYGPDCIMLDLEDSVTMAEKDAARLLVHNALKSIDYGETEMVVRINPPRPPTRSANLKPKSSRSRPNSAASDVQGLWRR